MSSTIVQNIKIKHAGKVIIDTVPPVGTVSINNDAGYTKDKKVSIALGASDATTAVKNMEVRNVDIIRDSSGNETTTVYDFVPLAYEDNFFWNLNDVEGHKKVEVKLRDYGNNISRLYSSSSARKFFNINNEEIEGLVKINDDIFSATMDEGKIYKTRNYPKLINNFSASQIVKTIINNNNVLYVAINETSTSKVYVYLDNEFTSLNTFGSLIVDMASYNGELYVVLENKELYKKDSSAWTKITTFLRDVLYIDGESDYLYIIFDDAINTVQIYNGTSFQEISILELFPEEEIADESSSSESSSESSSTQGQSSSTQTNSTSSSTERDRSTSSITVSESSISTEQKTSSTSSESSLSSSTVEESSGKSSPSSESFSSESYMAQFSESSESTAAESSSISSSQSTHSSSTVSEQSSSSSGDICNCGKYVDNSMYIDNIRFSNLKNIHTYDCNLFGRLINLGGGLLRVLLYKNVDRSAENEIAQSEDFYQETVGEEISLVESNGTGISGYFNYVSLFSGVVPHNFVILCEGENTSSLSSVSSSSDSSILSSSMSQDVMIGSGTEEDPFLVRTAENMAHVNANPTAFFKLVNDIDMSNVDSSIMDEHVPIGSEVVPFEGTFDGNGHIIENFSVNRPATDDVGLFGYTRNATIRKLGLHGASVVGKDNVGALIGRMSGGLVEQCYVYQGTIEGNNGVGGLIGRVEDNSDVLNSYSRNSALIASVYVGGLIGILEEVASVFYCYSTSLNVSVATDKGGLIGDIEDVVGDSEGEVVSAYWDTQSTGLASSAAGTGKITSLMKIQGTFIGWNFITIWGINPAINDGYPYLRPFSGIATLESSSSSTEAQEYSSSSSSSSLYDTAPLVLHKAGKEITW